MKAQNEFVPRWFTAPWDSGGYDPSSVVWSMVQSELDLDQDGKKEFLISTQWSSDYFNMLYLYEAVGNDSFQIVWWYSLYPYSNDYSTVTVSDLDGNGRQEILCLLDPIDTTYHGLYVFEWEGYDNGFPFVPTTTWDFGLGHWFQEGSSILANDLDNDGRQEVAVSFVESWDTYKSKVMIFSLQNDSLLNPTWQIEFVDSTTLSVVGYSLAATDLDKDNRKELVVSGWDTLRVAIYENTGSADSYALSVNIKNLSYYVDLVNDGFIEANFDNDATNELYMLTANGALFVATNSGDVSQMTAADFVWLAQYDVYNGMVGMTKADLDTNGVPELYLAGSYNEAVYRCEYLGGAVNDIYNYSYSTVFMDDTTDDHTSGDDQGYFRPTKIAAGDFDDDGVPDMIVSSASFALDKPVLLFVEQSQNVFVPINAGWNIVSVPSLVIDNKTSSLFPKATSSAFAFSETGYYQNDSLRVGVGYWLKFSTPETVAIAGYELLTDTNDVFSGWNMIGSVSDSVSVSSITTIPIGLIESSVFGYNSGYTSTEIIEPGKGYWLKANGSGKIILKTSTLQAKHSSGLISNHYLTRDSSPAKAGFGMTEPTKLEQSLRIHSKRHEQKLSKKTFVRGHRP
ncbi:MAG: VCBS repeat-containing protein [Ignavibacteriae bacterium]|nr:VCBS repeat-containing protein [Ignavibacteriota bacterium]